MALLHLWPVHAMVPITWTGKDTIIPEYIGDTTDRHMESSTGEAIWVADMIRQNDEIARKNGSIVSRGSISANQSNRIL